MPAYSLWLQVFEFFQIHLGDGADHQEDHYGDGGGRKAGKSQRLFQPGDGGVSGDGKADRRGAQLYIPALSQTGRYDRGGRD